MFTILGAAMTSHSLAATAPAQVVLPDTTLHLLVIMLISATPRNVAKDLAPQSVTITLTIYKAIIGMIDLTDKGALAGVPRRMQAMSMTTIH
jgi:hypothetical protein